MKPRHSDAESIEATAAAWLAQRDDVMTSGDEREFARWRAADPRHEAAVVRLERAWAALQPLRDFRPAAPRHPDRDLLVRPVRRKVRALPVVLTALGAAAALLLAATGWAPRPVSSPATGAIYATTVGGYERVMLADGSVLDLNGETSAEVRFTAGERRVKLVRGEANFTVAKNPARPFRVEAQGVAVRAVGTAFNVRIGVRDIEVLVTEGKVSVSDLARVALDAPTPTREGVAAQPDQRETVSELLLGANERALIATDRPFTGPVPSGPVVERVSIDVVRETLAWQGPSFVFHDTPLVQAVAQFNRRNQIQVVLGDTALEGVLVGGSFRAENVEAFVRLIATGGDIVVERPEPLRVVLRSAR